MKAKHWSQTMKNKDGKTVTVGDHNMGKKMAEMKKKKMMAGKKMMSK